MFCVQPSFLFANSVQATPTVRDVSLDTTLMGLRVLPAAMDVSYVLRVLAVKNVCPSSGSQQPLVVLSVLQHYWVVIDVWI